jgi:hypothetical protein
MSGSLDYVEAASCPSKNNQIHQKWHRILSCSMDFSIILGIYRHAQLKIKMKLENKIRNVQRRIMQPCAVHALC